MELQLLTSERLNCNQLANPIKRLKALNRTRTEPGRRWTACGFRPPGEQLIGDEYGYLSVALNAATGELFALILPDMTIESFQAFLDELASFVGEQSSIRLITDGAAAHRRRRLKFGERLTPEHLPAYSPERNRVERLFKERRAALKNRVFETVQAVEEAVIKAVEPFFRNSSRVKKLTFYGWLHTAPT